MKLMERSDLDTFGGISEFGEPVDGERQGPWIGELKVRVSQNGDPVDAVILAGQDDSGNAVNAIVYQVGPTETVELVRLVSRATAVERALRVENMGTVDLLTLGSLGYRFR